MKKVKGFTLIEIMIVVVIIGILASIAYPSYTDYVKKGYRTEGKSALLDIAAKQERYYMQNYKYAELSKLNVSNSTEAGKYTISIVLKNNNKEFVLTATNTFSDPECLTFIYTSKGEKKYTGSGNEYICW